MFSMDWENPAYLRVRASGRLGASDYDRFEPDFEAELERRGGRAPSTRSGQALLLDVRGWRGWTAGGFVRDFLFNVGHRNSFPRIAVVGDRPWHKWLTLAAKPMFRAKMRYFEAEREGEAVEWARG